MDRGEQVLDSDVRQDDLNNVPRNDSSDTITAQDAHDISRATQPNRTGNLSTAPSHKRLVICCDGTLNDSVYSKKHPTNVSRLARSIQDYADDGIPQVVFYHSGLGTIAGGFITRNVDAATGHGIGFQIRNLYNIICMNHGDPKDEVYLVGFSRGAYAVRCVASFIADVGLLTKYGLQHLSSLFKMWRKQREKGKTIEDVRTSLLYKNLKDRGLIRSPESVILKACIAWDTVSALGTPALHNAPQYRYGKLAFVDHDVPNTLEFAFHALALNEYRGDYKPVLWASDSDTTVVKQCWFMGAHSDVGGGNKDIGLTNLTFIWMIAQLREHTSIGICDDTVSKFLASCSPQQLTDARIAKNMHLLNSLRGKVTNSLKGIFLLSQVRMRDPMRYSHHIYQPRPKFRIELQVPWRVKMDNVDSDPLEQEVHFSVRLMMAKGWEVCPPLKRCQTTKTGRDGSSRVSWDRSLQATRDQEPRFTVDWNGRFVTIHRNPNRCTVQELRLHEAAVSDSEIRLLESWLAQQDSVVAQTDHTAETSESASSEEEVVDEKVFAPKRKNTETIIEFLRPLLAEARDASDTCMYKPREKKRFLCF